MPTAQIVKWGNSLAVRIPRPVAEEAGVREGDSITIEASEGRIQVRRQRQRVPTLRELVAPSAGPLLWSPTKPTIRPAGGLLSARSPAAAGLIHLPSRLRWTKSKAQCWWIISRVSTGALAEPNFTPRQTRPSLPKSAPT